MKENTFFIIFKRLSMKQIVQFLLESESPTLKKRQYFSIYDSNDNNPFWDECRAYSTIKHSKADTYV